MNSEEQTLIDGLFSRLQQAETDSAPRDAQAEARIKEHLIPPACGRLFHDTGDSGARGGTQKPR